MLSVINPLTIESVEGGGGGKSVDNEFDKFTWQKKTQLRILQVDYKPGTTVGMMNKTKSSAMCTSSAGSFSQVTHIVLKTN